MRYFFLILSFFAAALIQSVFFSSFIKPDLVLILVLCVSICEQKERALILSFAAAAIEGVFFSDMFFVNLFSLVLISFLALILKEKIFYENIIFIIVLCAAFTVFNDTIFYVFSFLYKTAPLYPFKGIILRLIINCALVLPVYYVCSGVFGEKEKIKLG